MKRNFLIRTYKFLISRHNIYLLNFINFLKLKSSIYVNKTYAISKKKNRNILKINKMEITYLSQALAQTIDNELMSEEIGYTTEQLMELAGLSISQIIFHEYSLSKFPKILICCGPGNNGGDGLVAARHLKEFGYDVAVNYPKENNKILFKRLLKLLENYEIKILKDITPDELNKYDLIIDSIFGFSFKGEPRKPFDDIIKMINNCKKSIVSVDVPSGYQIDSGDTGNLCINSEMNISLMLPKQGLKNYQKKHYLGGRFLPSSIIKKYNLKVPHFSGYNSFIML
ncbi:pyridoxal 5'-phosphate synthase, putative [Plasmodium gallinaceum]|uniref:NAD(P)H-hydrate epimerase n=1 Tax=Plasmodium gallinaceum TaxID=5849 RepID=A0A1J1GUS2_PLAGA|nr:pyridoxal 5'-phosphate synthase, putative [Plasmodium gallinaceum]CRG94793.1 pyridoxal 5'-phosphate synthase, putative [Plasmodium gallinaceum]